MLRFPYGATVCDCACHCCDPTVSPRCRTSPRWASQLPPRRGASPHRAADTSWQRPSVHLPAFRDRPWKKGTLNARRIAPGADTRAVGSPGLPAACRFLDSWALDRPHAHELIFGAQRRDFSRPSAEEMLRDMGLTPRDPVKQALEGMLGRCVRRAQHTTSRTSKSAGGFLIGGNPRDRCARNYCTTRSAGAVATISPL
jgi:hypothetical protein